MNNLHCSALSRRAGHLTIDDLPTGLGGLGLPRQLQNKYPGKLVAGFLELSSSKWSFIVARTVPSGSLQTLGRNAPHTCATGRFSSCHLASNRNA